MSEGGAARLGSGGEKKRSRIVMTITVSAGELFFFLLLHQLECFLLADVLLPAGRPGVLRTAGPLLSPPPPL